MSADSSGKSAEAAGEDKMMRSLSHSLSRAWPSDKNLTQSLRKEKQTMDTRKQETRVMSGLLRKASMLCKPGGGINPNHKALMKDLVLSNDSNIQLALEDSNLVENAHQLNRYLDLMSYEKASGNAQLTAEASKERKELVKTWQAKLEGLKYNNNNNGKAATQAEILEAEQRRIAQGLGSKRSRPGSMLQLTSFRDNNRVRTIPEETLTKQQSQSQSVSSGGLATIPGDKATTFSPSTLNASGMVGANGTVFSGVNLSVQNQQQQAQNGLKPQMNMFGGFNMLSGLNAMPGMNSFSNNAQLAAALQMQQSAQQQQQAMLLQSAQGNQSLNFGALPANSLAQQMQLQQQLQLQQFQQQQQQILGHLHHQQQNGLTGNAAAQARAMGITGLGGPSAMQFGLSQNVGMLINNTDVEREAQRQQRLSVRREKKSKRERQRRLVLNTLYDELGAMLFSNNEHETKDRASILQAAIDYLSKECKIAIPMKTESEAAEEQLSMSEQCIYPMCPNAAMQGKDCCFVHGGGGRKGSNLSPEERLMRRRGKKSKREKQRRHNVNVLSERLGEMLKVTEIKDKTTVLNVAISFLKQHPRAQTPNPNTAATADINLSYGPGSSKTGIAFLRQAQNRG